MSKTRFWEEPSLFPVSESPDRPVKSRTVPAELVDAIWCHYVETMASRGRKPELTESRIKLIERSIKRYGADDVKAAITGCANSEWHMGGNPQGKKYNSIELILRNAEKVEFFLQYSVVEESGGDPF